MQTKSFKSYLLGLSAVLYTIIPHGVPFRFEGDVINQLNLIGTIDGKSYFGDGNALLSWEDAKSLCASSGLELAVIESVAQSKLLKNLYNTTTFAGTHWIGGRDSLKPSQFSWDKNGDVISSEFIDPYEPQDGMLTCLCFNPGTQRFYGKACSIKYKVLCQLYHG